MKLVRVVAAVAVAATECCKYDTISIIRNGYYP
jgi:hypothetical protein